MSFIEITIKDEADGGEVWFELERNGERVFFILDFEAATLVRDILIHRRPGNYEFGPLDLNG